MKQRKIPQTRKADQKNRRTSSKSWYAVLHENFSSRYTVFSYHIPHVPFGHGALMLAKVPTTLGRMFPDTVTL